ncbi:hypothetical protein T07_10263 [Trichinella nelsoni]|uniref:Uncharacterized protein n=1 Tax=Trichinella nelsoni TaxID=6336 RepID=A0A0V0RLA8_9BILA|nr:hypothetical protein T07_10263 [Trichinella nelsoni]
MTSPGSMCSTAPTSAPRRRAPLPCLSDQVVLAVYRITQQVRHDDAIVRCWYTAKVEEVFQLLQTLRRVHLQSNAKAGAACKNLYGSPDSPPM